MRVVVAGGAGFVGSHLCERLCADGYDVVCVDDLSTGNLDNLAALDLTFIEADVSTSVPVDGPVDAVFHLASPASPPDYLAMPIHTLDVGSAGTRNLLELARSSDADFLLASTSEVYGDPLVHPQTEDYWGNVNPIGPRSVYDEAKRFSEAMTMAYRRTYGVRTHIARIFNTIGPRMRANDGRAVPAFASQALAGRPMTVHGDGSQTRSVGSVTDLVDGLVRLAASDAPGPVNLGNPEEVTMLELAQRVAAIVGVEPEIVFVERPTDDPTVRKPDITRARELLGWEPQVRLDDALRETIDWFRSTLGDQA